MKMFTDCSGECCICSSGDFCMAGHGDDHFWPASKEEVINRLDKGAYASYTNLMKQYLNTKYGYIYKEK